MYGVKDNFERVPEGNYGPDLPRAMKAKRNVIAFIVGVVVLVVALAWLLVATTPPFVWVPILGGVVTTGLLFLFVTFGIDWINSIAAKVRREFEIWDEAKKYGVRDE